MLRRRVLYALVLLLAVLGQILDVGYLFHFIFFAVLCLPLLGLAVSLPAMLGCRAILDASTQRVARGGTATWTLTLTNPFGLPLARASCRVRVSNAMTQELHTARAVLSRVAPEERRAWTLETDHCGAAECRVERLWVCDCLGLFALPVRRPCAAALLIVPLPEDPGPIQLPEGAGLPVPQHRGGAVYGELYDLRPYRPGDSPRMIHWKMTAKRDEPVTREPPEDQRPLPVLTLDHFGPLDRMDRALDRLEGYSRALLEQERPHEVRWLHPVNGAPRCRLVAGERDWENCLAAILADPAPLHGRSILAEPMARQSGGAIYQIHITGKEDPYGQT